MSELGGLDIGLPDEGAGSASESLSEAAAARFAASQAAAKQEQKQEKKAKKRDDNVAQLIMQFLTDSQKTHVATLVARLVALNCPSSFILAVLSLINEGCKESLHAYFEEKGIDPLSSAEHAQSMIPTQSALTEQANAELAQWIMRMEQVLQLEHAQVLHSLVVDDQNIDGTILQLTSFVLEDFLKSHGKEPAFEQMQQLSAGILQSVFTPYMHEHVRGRQELEGGDDE